MRVQPPLDCHTDPIMKNIGICRKRDDGKTDSCYNEDMDFNGRRGTMATGCYDKICIIIPSLNPDDKLLRLLKNLQEGGFSHILLVNDGSKEECMHYFREAEETYGCIVLRHHVNFGKGAALKTAFNHYLNTFPDFDGVITVDSDGQHGLEDIRKCADDMLANPDALILGSRDFASAGVPTRSRFGNVMTRNVFRLLCGVKIADTQTGLRAMSSPLVKRFLRTKGSRFEYEMNMLIDCSEERIPIRQVGIETVYIEENKSSHFNPIADSLKIYAVFGKFLLSSLSSFLIDFILFSCFSYVFQVAGLGVWYVWPATLGARVLSSMCNYLINRNAVFKSADDNGHCLVRYYALAVVQMMLSAGGVYGLVKLLSFNDKIAKLIVDTVLFLVSFRVQRGWVFRQRRER